MIEDDEISHVDIFGNTLKEEKLYQILRQHNLPLKKREAILRDLLTFFNDTESAAPQLLKQLKDCQLLLSEINRGITTKSLILEQMEDNKKAIKKALN